MSAVGFGLKQVFAKKSLEKEHAAEHLSSVMIIAFILTWIFMPKISFNYPLKVWGLMYLKAVVLTFSWLFAIKALRHLEISIVIPMLTLSPLVLMVIGILYLGEKPDISQYTGVLLLVGGAYWMQSDHDWKKALEPWKMLKNKYMLYILIPIFGYSICAALDKVILKTVNPQSFMFIGYGFLVIHYFIIQAYKYKGVKDIKHAFKVTPHWLALTGAALFISDILYFTAAAIPGSMISLIIPLKRTSVLIAVIVGGKMFHDHNLWYRVIGSLIMILGAVLVIL